MIALDGATGEGGGQVLRTALTLSMCTGQPFSIHDIRARRRNPGLMRQHLTALRAAAEVCGASIDGDALGSRTVSFRPGKVRAGDYRFAIGSAGSTTLVLQTVLPALLTAGAPSQVALEGGTHNPWAPPFDFLAQAFLPLVAKMGAQVEIDLVRAGFYPAGGGCIEARITPADSLAPLVLDDRGGLAQVRATARVAHLAFGIAQRELEVVRRRLSEYSPQLRAAELRDSAGPGNALNIAVECAHVTEVFTGFGERGRRAEAVAHRATRAALHYLRSDVVAGEHLADQLLVPLALAGGGRFTTVTPSSHTRTNIEVVQRFTAIPIAVDERRPHHWVVAVGDGY